MNSGLAALAIGIAVAGVLGVAARDTRSSVVAFAVAAVAAPLLTGGAPDPLPLAARLVAALLAAYLLWAAVRGLPGSTGSPLGLAAETMVAMAAWVAGYAAALVGVAGGAGVAGSPEAIAAGAALLASGAAPLVTSRDALRASLGALLVLHGAWLLRGGLLGPASAAEELGVAALVAALGAAGAALIARARGGS